MDKHINLIMYQNHLDKLIETYPIKETEFEVEVLSRLYLDKFFRLIGSEFSVNQFIDILIKLDTSEDSNLIPYYLSFVSESFIRSKYEGIKIRHIHEYKKQILGF